MANKEIGRIGQRRYGGTIYEEFLSTRRSNSKSSTEDSGCTLQWRYARSIRIRSEGQT